MARESPGRGPRGGGLEEKLAFSRAAGSARRQRDSKGKARWLEVPGARGVTAEAGKSQVPWGLTGHSEELESNSKGNREMIKDLT